MPTGVVKKLFKDKGFAFITPDAGSADIFAPVRTFVGIEANLREGLRAIFEFEIEARTNKPKATTWSIIEGAADPQAAVASAAAAAYGGMAGYNLAAAPYGAMAGGILGADRLSPYGQMHMGAMGYGVMPGAFGALGTLPTALDPNVACAAAALPLGWEAVTDPASGKVYYCNRSTGQSSWTPPVVASVAAAPAAATAGVTAAPADAAAAPEAAAATAPATDAATAPASSAAGPAASAPAMAQPGGVPASLPAGWETATDPSSGKPYYFNRATNETSWNPPAQ